jgi:4a-hydroxytetrahydrobiopterin dehydratase
MTEALASKTCTPCRGGIPPLTREQAELFHAQAPDWQLPEEAHRIERSFRFHNFREALTFVQEIGELAEAEGHHPNISFGWGNATAPPNRIALELPSMPPQRDCGPAQNQSAWRHEAQAACRPGSQCRRHPLRIRVGVARENRRYDARIHRRHKHRRSC